MAKIPATTQAARATSFGADTICVKWDTPAEEAIGIATLAGGIARDEGVPFERMGIAVPNYNWAVQMKRACGQLGLPATMCIKPARLSAEAQAVCSKLDALAHPDSDATRALWASLGYSRDEAQRLTDEYQDARACTLVRMLGMRDVPVLAHVLHHVRGSEDARELCELVQTQLACPTLPAGVPLVPIMHYQALCGSLDWLFLVGCVNGLIPGPRAFEAATEQERAQALNASRDALGNVLSHACKQVVLSGFTRLEATLAQQAHVRVARYKMERGRKLAMATPTVFLDEAGADRPSTVGGQALLRAHNLN